MNAARILWAMVLADFRERVRRYSFLLSMAFAVYLGYAVYAGQVALQLDGYRGVNNSAWIGSVLALVTSIWLSLVGFYVVKNTIQRDRETGVGQILATTPMTRWFYTLAKTVSNFAVLASMVFILAAAAVVIALVKGEAPATQGRVDWFALLAPLLLVGLTAMALTAAIAVLFESLPGLRGGLGNIVYFFVWIALLSFGVGDLVRGQGAETYFKDFTGIAMISGQMQAQLRAMDPAFRGGSSFTVGGLTPATKAFVWNGLHWTGGMVAGRLFWVAFAVALAGLAALFFDRFDPSSGTLRPAKSKSKPGTQEEPKAEAVFASAHLTPLARSAGKLRFGALVAAELRLMVRGRSWWWTLVAAALVIAGLASPVEAGRFGVLAAAWLWPTLIWSQMGVREAQDGTGPLIFSAARSFPRQLLAVWVAGVLVAVATGSGVAARMILAGDWQGVAAWAAGAIFIPALALTLGVWTESRKPFEALYTVWWYIGPLHQIRGMDFLGTTPASSTAVQFALAALVLVAAACVWRRARLAYA